MQTRALCLCKLGNVAWAYAHVILTLLHDALGCHKKLRVLSNDLASGCVHVSAFQQASDDFTALQVAETPVVITQTLNSDFAGYAKRNTVDQQVSAFGYIHRTPSALSTIAKLSIEAAMLA